MKKWEKDGDDRGKNISRKWNVQELKRTGETKGGLRRHFHVADGRSQAHNVSPRAVFFTRANAHQRNRYHDGHTKRSEPKTKDKVPVMPPQEHNVCCAGETDAQNIQFGQVGKHDRKCEHGWNGGTFPLKHAVNRFSIVEPPSGLLISDSNKTEEKRQGVDKSKVQVGEVKQVTENRKNTTQETHGKNAQMKGAGRLPRKVNLGGKQTATVDNHQRPRPTHADGRKGGGQLAQ